MGLVTDSGMVDGHGLRYERAVVGDQRLAGAGSGVD